ncbi:MAG: CRISPR-associated protein Csm2 [Thermotogaceae bacterium]|jgi:CRISPR-associated protein Csm2|nr:CRISPR-associated protein Csm2 [Thermotogaceae bacterium]
MGRENRPNNQRNQVNQFPVAENLKEKFSNPNFSFSNYEIEELIKDCKKFGEELANNRFKMAQLRKFHSHFTKIWTFLSSQSKTKEEKFNEVKPQIQFSKVYLAYQAARNRGDAYSEFEGVISALIDKVGSYEDFEKLKKFIDALVAYHKYHGGD